MENVVAARRLRKSMLKETKNNGLGILENLGISTNKKSSYEAFGKRNIKEIENEDGVRLDFKSKLIIKVFLSCLIVFACLVSKLLFVEYLNNNKYINVLKTEYNKDYSKQNICEFIENTTRKINIGTKYIIPQEFNLKIKEKYQNIIKPRIINFELKNFLFSFFKIEKKQENEKPVENINENQVVSENETEGINLNEINTGQGGGEPILESNNEEIKEEENLNLSQMDIDTKAILSKNISIVLPTNGTVTSRYGVRDEIFKGVNSYHTGIDIANKLGTNIKSATDGKVCDIVLNDKYYGNFILIEIDGVVFKYAHLSAINVAKEAVIKQGDIIGLMGSTGMSTGSHLHFEIRIDSRSVDPEKIIKI